MKRYMYINPGLLERIEAKYAEIAAAWGYDDPANEWRYNLRWQLREMVTAIETAAHHGCPEDTKLFYCGNGIVCDGWNGYRRQGFRSDFPDHVDPHKAHGGFYRTDTKWEDIAREIRHIADKPEEERAETADNSYSRTVNLGLILIWEPMEMRRGFQGFRAYYHREDAQAALEEVQAKRGYKAHVGPSLSDKSGCWTLHVYSTVSKPFPNAYSARVPADRIGEIPCKI